jgi:hypothetical protein
MQPTITPRINQPNNLSPSYPTCTIFTASYPIAAILTQTFNTQDINNLRGMVTALGPLQPLLNKILNFIEKLTTTLTPNKKSS